MNKKQMAQMVNAFLGWKLPKDFAPDAGISFKPTKPYEGDELGNSWWPIGTNLLTADQARQMLTEVVRPDMEAVCLMESTANMLRGMTLDPAIPAHAKDAMRDRIAELEAVVESRIAG